MNMKKGLLLALFVLPLLLFANDLTRQEYIDKYASLAIREMQSYGIPASITMAQGILESNNGNSYLAKEANNHFGIKCHDWTGPSVSKDDDKRNECFRKYDHVLASFEDHSSFLVERDRYAFLFDYDANDYKSWAKGLKKAGYATNPKYPQLLIRIIEENELYLLDDRALSEEEEEQVHLEENDDLDASEEVTHVAAELDVDYKQLGDEVYKTENGVSYIVITKDITVEQIANKYGLHVWEVYRFNDMHKDSDYQPYKGQRVYLEFKEFRGVKAAVPHKVQKGETMLDISQLHGIRLKSLCRINHVSVGTQPEPGSYIKLRR